MCEKGTLLETTSKFHSVIHLYTLPLNIVITLPETIMEVE